MSIVKLAKGTTTPTVLTITSIVRDVPPANPKYGAQHKFVGTTPTDPDACIFLAPATADRQLTRLGLTLDTVVGRTVEFTRPGDYIDMALPGGSAPVAAPAAPTNGKQAVTLGAPIAGLDTPEDVAAAKVDQWKRLCGLHKRCLAFVLETEVPMLDGPKVGASPESVSALTAQLFIAAKEAGLHR